MVEATVTPAKLNGKLAIGSQDGEVLVSNLPNVYWFPHGCGNADVPYRSVNLPQDAITRFLRANAHKVRIADAAVTVPQALHIAFLRLCCVRLGLVSPRFAPEAYHVNYTEAVQLTDAETNALLAEAGCPSADDVYNGLTVPVVNRQLLLVTDKICAVAYVFRSRGHHYLPSYEEVYTNLWRRCRYAPEDLILSWQHISRYALHAVYPVVLDGFYANAVRDSECNGALAKRFDVAPAGFAAVQTVYAGYQDLKMVAPGVQTKLEAEVEYLEGIVEAGKAHRFAGSVNAVYYGQRKIQIDEQKIASIAATIMACLRAFAPDSPLAQSPSLQRVANNAPITGAVLARQIRTLSDRPEVVDRLAHA